jgi:hypothetical protein
MRVMRNCEIYILLQEGTCTYTHTHVDTAVLVRNAPRCVNTAVRARTVGRGRGRGGEEEE